MSSAEQRFLDRVLKSFGLDAGTALMPTRGTDVAAAFAQLPDATRVQTLDLVVQAAAADGQVMPSERAFVDTIAKQLGVAPEAIDKRLTRMLGPG